MTVQFSPSDLQRCRSGVDPERQAVARAHTILTSTLDGLGPCWGTTSAGQTFAGKYLTPRDNMLTALTQLDTFLTNFTDSLDGAARAYHQTEEANTVR